MTLSTARCLPRSSSMAIRIDWVMQSAFVPQVYRLQWRDHYSIVSAHLWLIWAHVEDWSSCTALRIGRHSRGRQDDSVDKNVVVEEGARGRSFRPRHRARLLSPNRVSRSFPGDGRHQVSMTHHLDRPGAPALLFTSGTLSASILRALIRH